MEVKVERSADCCYLFWGTLSVLVLSKEMRKERRGERRNDGD
jgi:hypothetical protein